MQTEHKFIESNGIKIHFAEAGTGPLVLLCHGFPESWYSWRHQIKALSEAGYRVIAPDMRGYGQADRPNAIDQYSLFHLAGDMVGLVDAIGDGSAVVIGHDWGAPVAWHCALFRPDRFHAVAGLSVPFRPRGPAPHTSVMPRTDNEVFYQLYFQAEGIAEKEFEKDVRRTIRLFLAGSASKDSPPTSSMVPRQGGWLGSRPSPPSLPNWITENDIDFYAAELERTGFSGGLNWYRNIDRNWELMAPYAETRVEQPALFLTGELDLVRRFMPAEAMTGWVTDLREVVVPGAGHWVQQQEPQIVNEALL